ncbi:MAG: ThiF family adenylyltransferase [Rhodospirillaceae bacterium]
MCPPDSRGDFSRQSFLGEHSVERLAAAKVAIVGLGGGGSHIAQQLAHLGVGHYRLFDPQHIDSSNLNRLVTATAQDVEREAYKADILERTIKAIRPWADVIRVKNTWQTAQEQLRDAHVIFGCVDGFSAREALERTARRFLVPYIDIGMSVTNVTGGYAVGGQVIVSMPGRACMRCIGFLTDERLKREEDNYGAAGGVPQVVWSNGVLASTAVGAFVQLLCPWHSGLKETLWLEYDGNSQQVQWSKQPQYRIKGPCPHFKSDETGDPFFDITVAARQVSG